MIPNWLSKFSSLLPRVAGSVAIVSSAVAMGASPAHAQSSTAQIIVLYDAFGKTFTMKKDWGFSTVIEYGGKRILFDTGNNADIFAHNVEAKGIDLRQLDFAVVSHRHGDHTSGLNHLLKVNPAVKIYAPQENFGVFGAALPGTFYRRNESLPSEMRYFDGRPPETLRFGSAWPESNFTWITKTTEVAPGFHLILLNGTWGVDLEVKEISLAIDTPDGIVLVAGCSHSTIEKIVEAAKTAINKPIHLVLGGLHLLPAKDDQIGSIAVSLRDNWSVRYLAPVHCTGEPAFAILKEAFGDRYVYAGLGTTVHVCALPEWRPNHGGEWRLAAASGVADYVGGASPIARGLCLSHLRHRGRADQLWRGHRRPVPTRSRLCRSHS
jgi:7,8-dihydropterin-6-yl-methyl-4-(beta-D-ribofuranosyl)aminobenzene 5'-phosphate synthase